MHRKISSRLALEIILLLAVLVAGLAIIKTSVFDSENNTTGFFFTKRSEKKQKNDSCKKHVYMGEAKIKGWYTEIDGEWLFVISDEDLKKLPKYDDTEEYKEKNKQIKLIDVTPEIEKALVKTSEKKPQTITIKGYATRCEGAPSAFASLEYKEGIFREYL